MGSRCTDDMLSGCSLVHRAGHLELGNYFLWQLAWTGEKSASIASRAEAGRVFLDYRNLSANRAGGEWEPMSYAVGLEWTARAYGGESV